MRQIPDNVLKLAGELEGMMRAQIEDGGEVTLTAIIDTGDAGLLPLAGSMLSDKEDWAQLVRIASRAAGSRFVIVVSEAWTFVAPDSEAAQALRRSGDVKSMPGNKESVVIQIETQEGLWTGIAHIVTQGERRTFGTIKYEMASVSEGTLVGLLGSHHARQ